MHIQRTGAGAISLIKPAGLAQYDGPTDIYLEISSPFIYVKNQSILYNDIIIELRGTSYRRA